MMQTTTHIHYEGTEQITPRTMEHERAQVSIDLGPGIALFGPRDFLARLFTAAIDALGDRTVRWTADGAEVVALRGGTDAA